MSSIISLSTVKPVFLNNIAMKMTGKVSSEITEDDINSANNMVNKKITYTVDSNGNMNEVVGEETGALDEMLTGKIDEINNIYTNLQGQISSLSTVPVTLASQAASIAAIAAVPTAASAAPAALSQFISSISQVKASVGQVSLGLTTLTGKISELGIELPSAITTLSDTINGLLDKINKIPIS